MSKRFGLCVATLMVGLLLQGCSGESAEIRVPGVTEQEGQRGEATPGLSWWSRAAIDGFLRYQVWSEQRSGFVVMVARDGVPVHAYATGWADVESERPMTVGTPMRFASMTKPVTAVAAMQLVERGLLDLDAPIARYLPEFANLRVATSHMRN
jgi:CubicO group peptidase (beta-lactamase class C family)